jgi:hypothetical protein
MSRGQINHDDAGLSFLMVAGVWRVDATHASSVCIAPTGRPLNSYNHFTLTFTSTFPNDCAEQARLPRTNMAKNKQQQEKPTLSFDDMIKAGM